MNILQVKKFQLSRIIEQVKITYSPLGKAFEKQIKTIEDQGRKQAQVLKVSKPEERQQYLKSVEEVFPKEMRNNEIKNEIIKIKKWEKKIKRKNLTYKTKKYMYGFQQYKMIRYFGDSIFTCEINLKKTGGINLTSRCGFSSRKRMKP